MVQSQSRSCSCERSRGRYFWKFWLLIWVVIVLFVRVSYRLLLLVFFQGIALNLNCLLMELHGHVTADKTQFLILGIVIGALDATPFNWLRSERISTTNCDGLQHVAWCLEKISVIQLNKINMAKRSVYICVITAWKD